MIQLSYKITFSLLEIYVTTIKPGMGIKTTDFCLLHAHNTLYNSKFTFVK